ncbi:MAG: putative methylase [Blastocatellia bacterium]|jgi:hypothetical protein|nr:putative methylase [Blastocatellia bacterium]
MNSTKVKLRQDLLEAGWHSRGYLPHFEGGEIAQTINLSLADSLPKSVLERWNQELARDQIANASIVRERIERYLDQGYGDCVLTVTSTWPSWFRVPCFILMVSVTGFVPGW